MSQYPNWLSPPRRSPQLRSSQPPNGCGSWGCGEGVGAIGTGLGWGTRGVPERGCWPTVGQAMGVIEGSKAQDVRLSRTTRIVPRRAATRILREACMLPLSLSTRRSSGPAGLYPSSVCAQLGGESRMLVGAKHRALPMLRPRDLSEGRRAARAGPALSQLRQAARTGKIPRYPVRAASPGGQPGRDGLRPRAGAGGLPGRPYSAIPPLWPAPRPVARRRARGQPRRSSRWAMRLAKNERSARKKAPPRNARSLALCQLVTASGLYRI